MADIPVTYYKAVVRSQKFNPVNPPSMEEPPPVLNPPGSGPAEAFVPYEGALRDVNLGNKGITFETALFNDLAPNGILPRQLRWNNEDSTLDLGMGLGAVVQQMGQEVYHSPVKNQTGSTIPDGSLVAYSGSVGASGRINIQLAIGDGTIESRKILGIATHEILNGADGLVTWFGKVRGINTTGTPVGETWVLGNTLWAHPTQAGKLTNVKPTGPNLKVSAGIVVNVHATTGTILVNTNLGSNLDELHNVSIITPATNDIIQRNGSGVWVNKSLSVAGIVGGSGTLNYIPKWTPNGTTLGDSQIFDNGTNVGIGTATPTQGQLVVNKNIVANQQNANLITIGSVVGVENYPGIWFGSAAISLSNYALLADVGANQTILNAPATGAIDFRIGNAARSNVSDNGLSVNNGSTQATNTIDVNGTARIRTISNLGSAATNVMVPSATGVVNLRTVAEFRGDIGAQATIAGPLTNTYVATIVAGVPTWAAPSGGGSNWTISGDGIYRNSQVSIGSTILPTGSGTVKINSLGTTAGFFPLQIHSFADVLVASISKEGWFGSGNISPLVPFHSSRNVAGSTFDIRLVQASSTGTSGISIENNVGKKAILQLTGSAYPSGLANQFFIGLNSTGTDMILAPNFNSTGSTTEKTWFRNGGFTSTFNVAYFDINGLTFIDAKNIILGTTTGTKIGTATTQKLAFWNKTPIIQPTTAIAPATRVAILGASIMDTDTFDGYTVQQVVKALRDIGILA